MSTFENDSLIDFEYLKGAIEAMLMSSELPLTAKQIQSALEHGSPEMYERAIAQLNEEYRISKRSFEIQHLAGGYQIYTLPRYHRPVEKLWISRKRQGLTRSALETLAIISYRQPVTRLQIEEIRGVNSDSVLQGLLERGLIKISGRQTAPGRPILYSTTPEFLRYFGLKDLSELPRDRDFPELMIQQSDLFGNKITLSAEQSVNQVETESDLENNAEDTNKID